MEDIRMNPPNFISTLKTISEKNSENIAFSINGNSFTYAEFYQKVNAIAQELLIDNKQQLKVIVATNNDIETYASIIAIWLTGNIYIPLNLEGNNNKRTTIIRSIKPDLLLTSKPTEQNTLTKY